MSSLWTSGCATYKTRAEVAEQQRAQEEPPPPPARSCRSRARR
ncbi:MAG TPA: hypothetical protein VFB62_19320 [Polyangiaceae bacterium]|nr:hypothetical protein [Polyangiaceae bacterium]